MSRQLSASERATRIELLRARAAIERQSMVHGVQHLGKSLTPRGLLEMAMPQFGGRAKRQHRSPSTLLLQAFSFTRRYPMVLSMGSALLSTAARRKLRWWKLAAGAVLAWHASRNLRK